VVHADAVPNQPGQGLAEAGREPEVADQVGDGVLLGPAADVDAHQRLGLLQRRRLGEVHHVHRSLRRGQQLAKGLVQRLDRVGKDQRHRPLG
jgi:hypothetical protein